MLEDLGIIVKRLRHGHTWPNFVDPSGSSGLLQLLPPRLFAGDADYLSKSIGSDCIDMNAFSINPNLVVVDHNQVSHTARRKTGA
jgi:hypothetical protein